MSVPNLRTAQLQVLGGALAHLAHDVQNHLAIINESAGWMKDLMQLKSKQKFGKIGSFFKAGKQRAELEPFVNDLNMIEKQVNQASNLTRRLSNFAHGMEESRSIINGNHFLDNIRDVLLKLAAEKDISLEIKLTEDPSKIETDPSGFQLAVFENVEHVAEKMKSGDHLTMGSEVRDGQFRVYITGPCHSGYAGPAEGTDGQDFDWYIIENLGGRIQRQTADETCTTTMIFALAGEKT